jgi:tetratricopeptide (TPR) repeat protein
MEKTEKIQPEAESVNTPGKQKLFNISNLIIIVLLAVICILLYPRVFKKNRVEDLKDDTCRFSIAVMPFQNMTSDTLWNIWQVGIQNELITKLSNSGELSVRSYEVTNALLGKSDQMNQASLSYSSAGDISRRLEANTFIHGTIKSAGGMVRINAHLIDSKTEEIYKTFPIDGHGEEDIFIVIDSLASQVRDYLEIKVLEEDRYVYGTDATTQSPEAFRYFIEGQKLYGFFDWESSIEFFDRALEIDSLFSSALLQKAWALHNMVQSNNNLEMLERSKGYVQQLLSRLDELPLYMQLLIRYLQSDFDKDPYAGINYTERILEDDPFSISWWQQGFNYSRVGQYQKAVPYLEKMLDLIQQWGGVPGWTALYTTPGTCYHQLGNHKRENEIYEYGLSLNPDNPSIVFYQTICALSQGDQARSTTLLNSYRNILEAQGADNNWIDFRTGQIYRWAERYEKALELFRELLRRDPGNTGAAFQIASILIEQEMDLEEGMRMVEQLLTDNPGDWDAMVLKGMRLYKQDRIGEAHRILSEAWDLRPYYDHQHYQLLNETESAVVSRQ